MLGSLFKAAVNVAVLPVAVVTDILTLGEAEATEQVIEAIAENLDDAL